MSHTTTLDEYITKHISIHTGMKLTEYPNITIGEAVVVQFIIHGHSTHSTYKNFHDIWIETKGIAANIHKPRTTLKGSPFSKHGKTTKAGTPHGLKLPEHQKDSRTPPSNRMIDEAMDTAEAEGGRTRILWQENQGNPQFPPQYMSPYPQFQPSTPQGR